MVHLEFWLITYDLFCYLWKWSMRWPWNVCREASRGTQCTQSVMCVSSMCCLCHRSQNQRSHQSEHRGQHTLQWCPHQDDGSPLRHDVPRSLWYPLPKDVNSECCCELKPLNSRKRLTLEDGQRALSESEIGAAHFEDNGWTHSVSEVEPAGALDGIEVQCQAGWVGSTR